jgi:hypothetical protein
MHQKPWHQQYAITRQPRAFARAMFFRVLRSALQTDEGRDIAGETLGDLLAWRRDLPPGVVRYRPYDGLGRSGADVRAVGGARPIFITARFRTGSTLLWNIFRNTPGCTAYYEPLNERRWFDPAQRGTHTDSTHREIDDYWREYDGLEEAARYYSEEWIRRHLLMDERCWDPAMSAYIGLLISHAKTRPVLQFNRVDFRLPWLRRTFPEAIIVHLFRHPRDQWCSCFPEPGEFPAGGTMLEFAEHDHFYLRGWAADLRRHFPFLDERQGDPYELFYFIWKLSYAFGVTSADYSLRFEDLTARPVDELGRLFSAVGITDVDISSLAPLVVPTPSRWPKYADEAWFRVREERCEQVLAQFFDDRSPRRDRRTVALATDVA